MRDPNTFTVAVEGLGSFTCRRRTMRTAIAITAEYNRLTEGAEQVTDEFAGICNFISYLKVIIVAGPADWDPYLADPDSEADMDKLRRVYVAVKDAEARFRASPGADAQKPGAGAGGVD